MIDASFNRLKEALATSARSDIPDSSFQQHEELLLCRFPFDVAGFVFIDDAALEHYSRAYSTFKTLYRERKGEWDRLSLSFVLCRTAQEGEQDDFFTTIASDPYFCRKYVIFYHDDRDALGREVGKLPFLPLPTAGVGASARPVSAKRLLQNLDVSAELARDLVEPGRSSADSIWKSLEANKETLPSSESFALHKAPARIVSEAIASTRLRSITLDSFRAYREKFTFDLNAPIVVLYGPNGLGKTSIFDAIDFAATGRIGRLCRSKKSADEFATIATHLDRGSAQAEVFLEFSTRNGIGGDPQVLRRSVTEWNSAWIKNQRLDRRAVLQLLTGAGGAVAESSQNIGTLESLFRATHLFGQDDQELLLHFQDSSIVPDDLVSRMLALDDYASGIVKTDAVRAIATKTISAEVINENMLRDQLAEKLKVIEEFKRRRQAEAVHLPVSQLIDEIKAELSAVKIVPGTSDFSRESIAELQAIIGSDISQVQGRMAKCNQLIAALVGFAEEQALQAVDRVRVAEILDEQKAFQQQASDIRLRKAEKQVESEGISKRISQLEVVLKDILECQRLTVQMQAKASSLTNEEAALASVSSDISTKQVELGTFSGQRNQHAENEKSTSSQLVILEGQLSALESTEGRVRAFTAHVQEEATLRDDLAAQKAAVDSTEKELAELATKEISLSAAVSKAASEYDRLSAKEEELTRVLSDLDRFVHDAECPACGSTFDSINSVLEAMEARKGKRSQESAQSLLALNALKAELESLTAMATHARGRLADTSRRLSAIEDRLRTRNSERTLLNEELLRASLPIDLAGASEELVRKKSKILAAVARLRTESQQATMGHATAVAEEQRCAAALVTLRATSSQHTQAISTIREDLASLERSLAQIVSRSNIDKSTLATVKEQLQLVSREKEKLESRARTLTNELSEAKASEQASQNAQGDLLAQKEQIDKVLQQREASFSKVMSLCADLALPYPPTKQSVATVEGALANRIASLQRLQASLAQLSSALDIADALSQEVAETENVSQLQEQLAVCQSRRQRMRSAKKSLDRVSSLLVTQRDEAIATHVKRYGPLISLLQQRLRSVYGFGDIRLEPQDGGLLVQVDWNKRRVKPVDYFSDSQKQILMLSVFLGGCLRQNWSGFSPILLDDPVTHFDDLNAHAFVELIRGLVSTEPDRWQFVISTCEERLFALMHHKFAAQCKDAIFYRFIGMGEGGPIVDKITAGGASRVSLD